MEMNILEKLEWRYATKKFNPSLNVSESKLEILKKAIQFAPSSYGLQPFQVLFVKNPEIREKLKEVSWGQPQITDSSYVIVFTRKKNIDDAEVDSFVDNIINTRGVTKEMLAQYEGMMKGTVNSLTEDQKSSWVDKQIYIALGFLLNTAAIIDVDSCPMEGFDKQKYDEILGLTDTTSVVICPIGYRDENDESQHYKKVRKDEKDLFLHI